MIYFLFDLYTLFFSRFVNNEIMSVTFLLLFGTFTFMLVYRLVRGNY